MMGDGDLRRYGTSSGVPSWSRLAAGLVHAAVHAGAHLTASAPHVRDAANIQRLFFYFVVATVPALLVGLWNTGFQSGQVLIQAGLTELPGWRGAVTNALGWTPVHAGGLASLLVGLSYFLPLFVVSLAVAALWEIVFARLGSRPPESGVWMTAWLYTLLLPASLSPLFAAIGISFGVVFGKHVFGGIGKYIVSPALLGVLFLYFSYPAQMGNAAALAVPGVETSTVLAEFADGGLDKVALAGISWLDVFVGREPGALGVTSALACGIGALFLAALGVASLRVMAGALLGLLLATSLALSIAPAVSLPWHWQASVGAFAFGVAFIATDPVAGAVTRAGRWIYGLLIGLLVVLIRTADPTHPDGTLFAILLASLFAPLIDFCVVQLQLRRRRRRRVGRT